MIRDLDAKIIPDKLKLYNCLSYIIILGTIIKYEYATIIYYQ